MKSSRPGYTNESFENSIKLIKDAAKQYKGQHNDFLELVLAGLVNEMNTLGFDNAKKIKYFEQLHEYNLKVENKQLENFILNNIQKINKNHPLVTSRLSEQSAVAAKPDKEKITRLASKTQTDRSTSSTPIKSLSFDFDKFKKIYAALYYGETTLFKRNFHLHISEEEVKAHAKNNKNSRTFIALQILQTSKTDEEIFKKVHTHCFNHSGLFSYTSNTKHSIPKVEPQKGTRTDIILDKLNFKISR